VHDAPLFKLKGGGPHFLDSQGSCWTAAYIQEGREAGAGVPARIRFTPTILPPYARRSRSLDTLIPILYLKRVSTGDFGAALAALLGKDAFGLSATTIARLKDVWIDEHKLWSERDLSAKSYVYVWADASTCRRVLRTRRNGSSSHRRHANLVRLAQRVALQTRDSSRRDHARNAQMIEDTTRRSADSPAKRHWMPAHSVAG
jgi:hypothetical protein